MRVVPAVEGHEVFSEAAGTKEHKPDLEAAVAVDDGVLLLGSGLHPGADARRPGPPGRRAGGR